MVRTYPAPKASTPRKDAAKDNKGAKGATANKQAPGPAEQK